MTPKQLMSRCPYKEGSASRKLFAALARAGMDGLTFAEVSRAAHVPAEKTRTLLNAYQNPYHCSSLTRNAIRLILKDGLYRLETCKAEPNAHRPPPKKESHAEYPNSSHVRNSALPMSLLRTLLARKPDRNQMPPLPIMRDRRRVAVKNCP